MSFKTYNVKRGTLYKGELSEERFQKEVELALASRPFATVEEISLTLGTNQQSLKEFMDDYIVRIVKENMGINFNKLCQRYKIRAQYILDLIEEGRLEIPTPSNLQAIINEQSKMDEVRNRNNDLLNELKSISQTPTNFSVQNNKEKQVITEGFHFRSSKR